MLIPLTNFNFIFGDVSLTVSERYKYLGLVLTGNLDYGTIASIVVKSAGIALGLLIANIKAYGGLPFDCYTRLYDSLVQSIIGYGSIM